MPPARRILAVTIVCTVVAGVITAKVTKRSTAAPTRLCVYTGNHVDQLPTFSRLIGRSVSCAEVFNTAAPDWNAWQHPWFVNYAHSPDRNWSGWAAAPGTDRMLVITIGLVPASALTSDWRRQGASGMYAGYARELARYLIAAGLGRSVIRLAPEANYPSAFDWIGPSQRDVTDWRTFWHTTVFAMRSVAHAQFSFNWCINAAVKPISLASFYPGSDAVDSIGIDAYDSGVPRRQPRWATIYGRPAGIKELAAFATAQRKPFTIPEWGIGPQTSYQAGGDDPAYVNGIASVLGHEHAAFSAYFFSDVWAAQLQRSPMSLAAYRAHFGRGASG